MKITFKCKKKITKEAHLFSNNSELFLFDFDAEEIEKGKSYEITIKEIKGR